MTIHTGSITAPPSCKPPKKWAQIGVRTTLAKDIAETSSGSYGPITYYVNYWTAPSTILSKVHTVSVGSVQTICWGLFGTVYDAVSQTVQLRRDGSTVIDSITALGGVRFLRITSESGISAGDHTYDIYITKTGTGVPGYQGHAFLGVSEFV